MAFSSYTSLVTDCILRLRQVGGTATQLYSEGVIGSYIQEGYSLLRDEAYWPWLMKRITGTLDGTTGKVNSSTLFPSAGVASFEDIQAVFHDTWQSRLPKLDEAVNITGTYGNMARYVQPLSIHDDPLGAYLFQVFPHSTTGAVHVLARCDPANLFTNPAVLVPMDKWLLINYTAWRYFTDDAANPGAAAAALQVFDRLKTQLMGKVNDEPFWFAPGITNSNNEWQELN